MVSPLNAFRSRRARKNNKTAQDIKQDLDSINQEINYSTDKAAEAFLDGDMSKFHALSKRASQAFADYRGWDKESSNFELTKSRANYQSFRERQNLDGSKNPLTDKIRRKYKSNNEDYRKAMEMVQDKIIRASIYPPFDDPEETRKNYDDVVSGVKEPPVYDAEIIDDEGHEEGNAQNSDDIIDAEVVDAEVVGEEGGSSQDIVPLRDIAPLRGNKGNHQGRQQEARNTNTRTVDPEEDENPQANGRALFNSFMAGSSGGGRGGSSGGGRGGSSGGKNNRSETGDEPSGFFRTIEDATGLGNHGQFRVTWRPRVGPFIFNMGRSGLTSISLKSGPLRYMLWGRDIDSGFSSMDLPSGLSFRGNRRRK